MIESNIIKKFIVKSFLQYSRFSLEEITGKILDILNYKFFINETVIIKKTGKIAKIIDYNKNNKYTVLLLPDIKLEIFYSDIERKNKINYEDIFYFLERVTQETAFGHILIENVFDKILKPGFWDQKENIKKQKKI